MKPELIKLGARIRGFREEAGFTQDEVSQAAGISKGFLSDLENGKRNPSAMTVLALAILFGCSTDEIITGKVYKAGPCRKCAKIKKLLAGME